jgi:hypothetical protein
VKESLGAESTDVLNAQPQLSVPDALDDIYESESETEPVNPRREGLPPSFRMRHDKHYVEELMSTPSITQGAAPAAAPRPSGTAGAPGVDDRRAAPDAQPRASAGAVELIASRLESLVAHGAVSGGSAASTDPVGRTVQAELLRVTRFARAVAIIARRSEPVRRPVTAGEIAAAVRSGCTRVARLNGLDCLVSADDAGFAVSVERALIVQAIAGTVDALLDLTYVHGGDDSMEEGGRVSVSLQAARVRPALIVDVECTALAWRPASADRLFDNNVQDFAAAPAAGILLASAAHVVRLHGGRVEMQPQSGVTLRYVFPQ